MAKWGLFERAGKEATQVYEGDTMSSKDEYVYIMKKIGGTGKQVAAIRLAEGQSVKMIED